MVFYVVKDGVTYGYDKSPTLYDEQVADHAKGAKYWEDILLMLYKQLAERNKIYNNMPNDNKFAKNQYLTRVIQLTKNSIADYTGYYKTWISAHPNPTPPKLLSTTYPPVITPPVIPPVLPPVKPPVLPPVKPPIIPPVLPPVKPPVTPPIIPPVIPPVLPPPPTGTPPPPPPPKVIPPPPIIPTVPPITPIGGTPIVIPTPPPTVGGSLPDPFGIGSLFTGFANYVKPTIDAAVKGVTDAANSLFKSFTTIPEQDSEFLIDNAPAIALGVAGTAMAASIGIYVATTAGDLLHPIKGTGLVPLGINLVDKLGTGLITTSIAGAFATIALAQPLKYSYNRQMRTYRPSGSIIDQMFFEGHIDYEQWFKLYTYQGWPNNLILAQFKTMFIEPSDRLLIKMFEDETLDPEWIKQKLKERGYTPADIHVISQVGINSANDKTRLTRISAIDTGYKKGYYPQTILKSTYESMKFRPAQVTQLLHNASLGRDLELRNVTLNTLEQLYHSEQITEKAFDSDVGGIIKDTFTLFNYLQLHHSRFLQKKTKPDKLELVEGTATISKARFVEGVTDEKQFKAELVNLQKSPNDIEIAFYEAQLMKGLKLFRDEQDKKKVVKTVIEEGTTAISKTRLVEGLTDEKQFKSELTSLKKSPEEIGIALYEAQLSKELITFRLKKQADKEKVKVAKSGREAASVARYVQGFTSRKIFDGELTILGKTPEERQLIILAADFARDTDYRKDQLAVIQNAFLKDIYTIDEFEQEANKLFNDPIAAEQFINISLLKKAPRPKPTEEV